MDQQYQNVDIAKLREYFNPNEVFGMDDDFFVTEVKSESGSHFYNFSIKSEDFLTILCRSGEFSISSATSKISVKAPSIVVCPTDTVLTMQRSSEMDILPPDCILIAISKNFIFDLKIDISKILGKLQIAKFEPCIKLSEAELVVAEGYFRIIHDVFFSDIPTKRECITGLLSSMINMLSGLITARLPKVTTGYKEAGGSRSKTVFIDFVHLVNEYHEEERNVKFYADKMCLTPKYLSKLVKDASGHSASEIIDSMVISKAKNLLRYSDTAIKVIVAQLNFPNQSSFNKFFKAKTGMTPLKYRNS